MYRKRRPTDIKVIVIEKWNIFRLVERIHESAGNYAINKPNFTLKFTFSRQNLTKTYISSCFLIIIHASSQLAYIKHFFC